MSIGTTLKAARERSGLTIAQVAERTRMIHQLVEDIEQDDFHRIIAAVYGRGFIKLFAECVDEDPAPLVQEFNEIYSGARRPAVRTRPVQTSTDEPDTVEAADAAPHRPKVRAVTVLDEEPVAASKSEVSTGSDAPAVRPQPAIKSPAAKPAPEPAPAPAPQPAPQPAPEPAPQPAPQPAPEPAPAPAPAPEPSPEPAPQPAPEPAPQPAPEPAPQPVPEPAPQPAPEPAPEPMPEPAPESPAGKATSDTAGRDAPMERPHPVADESEAPSKALSPRAPLPAPQPAPKSDVEENDEGSLGELFDLGNRTNTESRPEKVAQNADSKGEGSTLRIPLTHQAPSWDDAPLSEGDFWQKISNLDKWKYWKVAAAIAGLCLLSVLVVAIVSGRRDRPQGDENVAVAVQPPPSEEPAEPAAAPAATMETDGRSVFTENLVPPPDSYVD